MYSIFLVASFRLVREAVRALIERHKDFQIIGEAEDRPHILQLLTSLHPDLILFDLDPDYAAAIETIKAILRDRPGSRIIALSMRVDDAVVESAVRAGVRGFVAKGEPSGDLAEVLRTVAQGGAYLSPHVAAQLMGWVKNRELKRAPDPALDVLTEREVLVLRLLAEGRTNKEVASSLNLGVETVRSYRKSMMRKLKLRNMAALMRFAVSAGLIVITGPTEPGTFGNGTSA